MIYHWQFVGTLEYYVVGRIFGSNSEAGIWCIGTMGGDPSSKRDCSLQYHQCNFGSNVYDGIIMYCFVGGITYGITPVWGTWSDPPTRVGTFCATPHIVKNDTAHILHSSSHFIYHQYNYGSINHDGLDGEFQVSGFTKEGRNVGTWADPITRVGFMSESWAPKDKIAIITGSMHIIYFIMMIIKILVMKDYLLVVILLVLEV